MLDGISHLICVLTDKQPGCINTDTLECAGSSLALIPSFFSFGTHRIVSKHISTELKAAPTDHGPCRRLQGMLTGGDVTSGLPDMQRAVDQPAFLDLVRICLPPLPAVV
jgi:hypothetical protein